MQGRKGYSKGRVAYNPNGDEIDGLIYDKAPWLAVIPVPWNDAGWYQVVHRPTRLIACHCHTRDVAFAVVDAIAPIEGLEEQNLRQHVPERVKLAIAEAMGQINKPPPPPPPPERERTKLVPVYDGRTPGKAVRAADRLLGDVLGKMMDGGEGVTQEGYTEALYRSRLAHLRESIMARTKATLTDRDVDAAVGLLIRQKQPEPGYLVDGTKCTWEGFKRSLKVLVDLGDQLADVAEQICDFCEARPDGWTDADQLEFAELDDHFRQIVCEGWTEWTAAVQHLHYSPPDRQAQVVRHLGFIGSDKRGWHELGRKTLLRHEYVLIDARKYRAAAHDRRRK